MLDSFYIADRGDYLLQSGAAAHVFDVLREIADFRLAYFYDAARIWLLLAGDQAKYSGFAGAVGPYKPDFFARIDLKGCVLE